MIIGIEASRANRREKTGVEWYSFHVIQEMKKLAGSEDHSWLLYTNEPLAMGLERGSAHWHERRLTWPPKYLWTQVRLSYEMMTRPPEVLFVPAHVLPRIIPKRTVVTIHDVGFDRLPSLYKPRQIAYHRAMTEDVVKRASRIITVSEFSKQEIIELYHADPARIFVTHLGIDHTRYKPMDATVMERIMGRFRLANPYLLFIGRLEAKKNLLTVIDAFKRYKEMRGEGDPLQLVFAGIPGKDFQAIEDAYHASGLGDAIRFLGYVSEEEKIALLSGATALVHPAWYEGFGIPPLEAMACGAPVICSNAASLLEVVGEDNALFFAPHDTDALMQQIVRLMEEPDLAESLRARGFAWVQQYDWHKTALQTLELLTRW
ncbi:MAG: glycosyltransferase family 1 protein [Patescibacteria group bacterium]